jgi:hypothetical protein
MGGAELRGHLCKSILVAVSDQPLGTASLFLDQLLVPCPVEEYRATTAASGVAAVPNGDDPTTEQS